MLGERRGGELELAVEDVGHLRIREQDSMGGGVIVGERGPVDKDNDNKIVGGGGIGRRLIDCG